MIDSWFDKTLLKDGSYDIRHRKLEKVKPNQLQKIIQWVRSLAGNDVQKEKDISKIRCALRWHKMDVYPFFWCTYVHRSSVFKYAEISMGIGGERLPNLKPSDRWSIQVRWSTGLISSLLRKMKWRISTFNLNSEPTTQHPPTPFTFNPMQSERTQEGWPLRW